MVGAIFLYYLYAHDGTQDDEDEKRRREGDEDIEEDDEKEKKKRDSERPGERQDGRGRRTNEREGKRRKRREGRKGTNLFFYKGRGGEHIWGDTFTNRTTKGVQYKLYFNTKIKLRIEEAESRLNQHVPYTVRPPIIPGPTKRKQENGME
ncbi:hypothetical protein EDD18DRAFT_1101610 [Armillaria luteobubalina]|uniref:Uncharacterized protein n=1 Tax=Armillaria luteobubalina TaxID=153913 RepID=A0AA39QDY9_9AGAR|nr:hypothetical protein EDD18DRAFT_1101610 [Armillaria luteobubalina]